MKRNALKSRNEPAQNSGGKDRSRPEQEPDSHDHLMAPFVIDKNVCPVARRKHFSLTLTRGGVYGIGILETISSAGGPEALRTERLPPRVPTGFPRAHTSISTTI